MPNAVPGYILFDQQRVFVGPHWVPISWSELMSLPLPAAKTIFFVLSSGIIIGPKATVGSKVFVRLRQRFKNGAPSKDLWATTYELVNTDLAFVLTRAGVLTPDTSQGASELVVEWQADSQLMLPRAQGNMVSFNGIAVIDDPNAAVVAKSTHFISTKQPQTRHYGPTWESIMLTPDLTPTTDGGTILFFADLGMPVAPQGGPACTYRVRVREFSLTGGKQPKYFSNWHDGVVAQQEMDWAGNSCTIIGGYSRLNVPKDVQLSLEIQCDAPATSLLFPPDTPICLFVLQEVHGQGPLAPLLNFKRYVSLADVGLSTIQAIDPTIPRNENTLSVSRPVAPNGGVTQAFGSWGSTYMAPTVPDSTYAAVSLLNWSNERMGYNEYLNQAGPMLLAASTRGLAPEPTTVAVTLFGDSITVKPVDPYDWATLRASSSSFLLTLYQPN